MAPFSIVIPKELDLVFSEKEGIKIVSFPKDKIKGVLGNVRMGSTAEIHLQNKQIKVIGELRVIGQTSLELTTDKTFSMWDSVNWIG